MEKEERNDIHYLQLTDYLKTIDHYLAISGSNKKAAYSKSANVTRLGIFKVTFSFPPSPRREINCDKAFVKKTVVFLLGKIMLIM